MKRSSIIAIVLMFLFATSSMAAILNVPAEFDSIQAAIDAAAEEDTVLVANGTYTGPGNIDIDLLGKAITVISSNGPESCIIDCDGSKRGFKIHSGEAATTVISGFKVVNGTATDGSGLQCDGASPTLENCIFQNCSRTESSPKGVLYFNESSATVSNCLITENEMDSGWGVGMKIVNSSLEILGSTISKNSGHTCGGIWVEQSHVIMTNCIITNNTAKSQAGGVYFKDSTAVVTNCEISFNTVFERVYSSYEGDCGGIRINHSDVDINDCLIKGNQAPEYGGGIYIDNYDKAVSIKRCTFENNRASFGGGIYCSLCPDLVIGGSQNDANTFKSNYASLGAELFEANNVYEPINAMFNTFDGYHLHNICIYPQERFDLTGCSSVVPIEQDVYVSPLGHDDNDGLTPETPFKTLYKTMRVLLPRADNPLTVHLQSGIYSPSATGEYFPVSLLGHLKIFGEDPDDVTLDAEGERGVLYGNGTDNINISGITVTGGTGGGVYLTKGSALVNNVKIRLNKNDGYSSAGGGVSATNADLTIQYSLIEENSSSYNGGGIYFASGVRTLLVRDCIIRNNSCRGLGGGIASIYTSNCTAKITNSAILNNYASEGGGGICSGGLIVENYQSEISNCVIKGNACSSPGAGIMLAGNWHVSHCDISGNNGSGIHANSCFTTMLTNCIVTDNNGSGISLFPTLFGLIFDCKISNCTIVRNSGTGINCVFSYQTESAQLSNSIIWGNNEESIALRNYVNGVFEVSHCCISGWYPGDGNIGFDPCFQGNQDFHLRGTSPCIDAGTGEQIETDLDGNDRVQGYGIDIGAYEFSGMPEVPRTTLKMSNRNPGPGDIVSCSVDVWNPYSETISGYPLVVLLDLFGEIFYAPSFSNYDHYSMNFNEGMTTITVLPEFTWPNGVGNLWGLVWYSTLTNPEITVLHGHMDTLTFGWHE